MPDTMAVSVTGVVGAAGLGEAEQETLPVDIKRNEAVACVALATMRGRGLLALVETPEAVKTVQ